MTQPDLFADRHIGPSEADVAKMLAALGYGSLDDLVGAAVPAVIRSFDGFGLSAYPCVGDSMEAEAALARELEKLIRVEKWKPSASLLSARRPCRQP